MTKDPSVLQVRTNDRMGWRPDVPDYRDYRFSSRLGVEAQKPVRPGLLVAKGVVGIKGRIDQLTSSSCVGQAIAVHFAAERGVALRSGLQIYYEARRIIGETDRDEGAYIRDGIKVASTLGAGRQSWWPMSMDKVLVDPPLKVDRDALLRRIFHYYRLEGANDYQACLSSGHSFVVGIAIFSRFMSSVVARTGVAFWPQASERFEGGHAVCVYGYDPDFRNSRWAIDATLAGVDESYVPERAYLCRNSWGRDWGRSGDFAIDADYLEHPYLADDAWTVRKTAPTA